MITKKRKKAILLKFFGIADCHGIESFLPAEQMKDRIIDLTIRSMSNRHRHSVIYTAMMTEQTAELVQRMMDKKKFKQALRILKEGAVKIEVEKGFQSSWDMIPNDQLDAWNPNGYEKED